jgi:hypothetical protein
VRCFTTVDPGDKEMSLQHTESRHIGKVGWFAIGALAASLAFVMLILAGDYFRAYGKQPPAEAHMPAVIIEAN